MAPGNERRSEYLSIVEMLDHRLSKLSDTTYIAIKDLSDKVDEKFDKVKSDFDDRLEKTEQRFEKKIEELVQNIEKTTDLKIANQISTHVSTCQAKQAPNGSNGWREGFSKVLSDVPIYVRSLFVLGALLSMVNIGCSHKETDYNKEFEKLKKLDSVVKMIETPVDYKLDKQKYGE